MARQILDCGGKLLCGMPVFNTKPYIEVIHMMWLCACVRSWLSDSTYGGIVQNGHSWSEEAVGKYMVQHGARGQCFCQDPGFWVWDGNVFLQINPSASCPHFILIDISQFVLKYCHVCIVPVFTRGTQLLELAVIYFLFLNFRIVASFWTLSMGCRVTEGGTKFHNEPH